MRLLKVKDIEIISEMIKSYPDPDNYIQLSVLIENTKKSTDASDEKIISLIRYLIRNEVIVDHNYLPIYVAQADKYLGNVSDSNKTLSLKEDFKVRINSFCKKLPEAIDSCPKKTSSLTHYQLKALEM